MIDMLLIRGIITWSNECIKKQWVDRRSALLLLIRLQSLKLLLERLR